MKAFIKRNGQKESVDLQEDSILLLVTKSIIRGSVEIPELTEHFRKVFENEAKAWEFQNMVQH